MEKEELSKTGNDGRGEDEAVVVSVCSNSEMKVARFGSGAADLMLTSSHFESLPELAKWWTLVSDCIQHSKDDPSPSALLIDAPWLDEFRVTIKNILQSRNIGDRERQLALTLACSMTSALGTAWMGKEPKFLQLLTSLAAIDVRMMLDRETGAERDGDAGFDSVYIARCCELLETALHCAASVEDGSKEDDAVVLTEAQALQINGTLLGLTEFLLQYLAAMDERSLKMPNCVSYPLYRFVCAYLGQALALVRPDNLMAAAKPLFVLNRDIMAEDQVDSTALLCPALYQLIEMGPEWNNVKKIFRDQGVVHLLETYLERNQIVSAYDQQVLQAWKDL